MPYFKIGYSQFLKEDDFYRSCTIYNRIQRRLEFIEQESEIKSVSIYVASQEIVNRFGEAEVYLRPLCVEVLFSNEENNILSENDKEIKRMLKNMGTCFRVINMLHVQYMARRNETKEDEIKTEDQLRDRIYKFVNKKNAYKHFDEEVRKRILGQPEISRVTYNVFSWLKGLAYGTDNKNNVILAAPSGSGKTETYRVIKEILNKEIGTIPIIQVDMTQLTQEGFNGKNVDEFLNQLLTESINGIAIVVLDELDKKLMPLYERFGSNVNASIQSQILTVVEGTIFTNKKGDKAVDTRNTLFIGAGAFAELREKKKETKKSIGFFSEPLETSIEAEYAELTVKDIIEAGALKEFMGRFSTIINYQSLSRDCVAIIAERYLEEYATIIGCEIAYTDEAMDYLYEEYSEGDLGCRIIKSDIWNMISPSAIEYEMLSKSKKQKVDCILLGYNCSRIKFVNEEEYEVERFSA